MPTRTAVAAVILLAALTSCSTTTGDDKPAATPTANATADADDVKLEPEWTPKLAAAQGNAISDCTTPSSTACSDAVYRIMTVVYDLDTAIEQSGKRYAETTAQIVTMQDAEKVYIDEGCAGDPAADDPNSPCTTVVNITLGASTLQMTLFTDDVTY